MTEGKPSVDLDGLERLAKAATDTTGATLNRYEHGGGRLFIDGTRRELIADLYGEADREFYAAANPQAILSLISLAREAEGMREAGNDLLRALAYHRKDPTMENANRVGSARVAMEQALQPKDTSNG